VRCGHPIPIDPSSRRIRLGWGIGRHRMNEPTRPTYPKWVILLSGALSGAAAILYVGLILPGVGLHFWTVSMAYHVEGIGPAILALLFPIGAELFWAFKAWREFGFANIYTLAVIIYGVLCPLMAGLFAIVEAHLS
jgi:hypothetical protein